MIGFIGLFDIALDYTLQLIITHTHTHYCPHSRLHCRCLLAASNRVCSPSSGFPNHPWPQLPASNSNSTQRLNRNSSLTDSPTNSLTHEPTDSLQRVIVTLRRSVFCRQPFRTVEHPFLLFFTQGLGMSLFRPHLWLFHLLCLYTCLGIQIPSILWRRSFSFSPLFFCYFPMKKFSFAPLTSVLLQPSSSLHPRRFADTCLSFASSFYCGHVISLWWCYLLLRMSHLTQRREVYSAVLMLRSHRTVFLPQRQFHRIGSKFSVHAFRFFSVLRRTRSLASSRDGREHVSRHVLVSPSSS
jgi:hypothetical protein